MISDDTEHTLFVAQSLLKHPSDVSAFQRTLAWHLRWWFLGLPAGVGLATARACVRLCLGFPPTRSGVFSAGNGPAMRSAILGGYFQDDPDAIDAFVRAATPITHTVPVVTYAWWRHYGDFRSTLEAVLDCGGDTDTTGAIAGALAGATVGENGIPNSWLTGIVDWPRSVGLLHRVAERLAQQRQTGQPLEPVSYFWPAVLPRNLLFLAVVLAHGFRRLAPPY
jgi:ADP-ribosylglycohydrolase